MTSPDIRRVTDHLRESCRVKEQAALECGEPILAAAGLIAGVFRSGGKVLLCGNGGSAADAQHLAAEFVSVLERDRVRPALPAVALTTDTSLLTASANDFGFEHVFARQVEALGRRGDALVAISTSGTSPNVLAALRQARATGVQTVGFTGRSGGGMVELSDVLIKIPSESTQHIQEAHIAVGHILCELVERELGYRE